MKYKLFIEYCGTNYSGWQMQKNSRTIQGVLTETIKTIFKTAKGDSRLLALQGSGRTDKGVHAIEQVAHIECETMLAPEILKMKMNDLLPSDINILEIEKAEKKFHARHSAKEREYIFRISERRTALEKKYVWWVKDKLNFRIMKECSNLFIGMHDFSSFCDLEDEELSTKVFVSETELKKTEHIIIFRIRASHFLWKMVRRLTGVIVEAGREKIKIKEIEYALNNQTNIFSKYTAPPSGLFLNKVFY